VIEIHPKLQVDGAAWPAMIELQLADLQPRLEAGGPKFCLEAYQSGLQNSEQSSVGAVCHPGDISNV
jgi:hypothetical protein